MYRRAIGQQPAKHTVDGAAHGLTVHLTCHVTGLDLVADVQYRMEHSVRRGPQHPLAGVAADEAGDIGVGQRRAVIDDPAQGVAAHGLHHRVAVHPGGEARADTHHHRRVGDMCPQILLGQNSVHQRTGVQRRETCQLRIGQHRHDALRQQGQRLFRRLRAGGMDALHHRLAVGDGRGKAHGAADGRGLGQVGHDHLHSAAVQPQGDAGGDVPRAAYQDQHSPSSFRCSYSSTTENGCQHGPGLIE